MKRQKKRDSEREGEKDRYWEEKGIDSLEKYKKRRERKKEEVEGKGELEQK